MKNSSPKTLIVGIIHLILSVALLIITVPSLAKQFSSLQTIGLAMLLSFGVYHLASQLFDVISYAYSRSAKRK